MSIPKIVILSGLVILLFLASQGLLKQNIWTGYFYPDINDYENFTSSPNLNSYDQSIEWVNSQVVKFSIQSRAEYDYECGKNCKIINGINHCDDNIQ